MGIVWLNLLCEVNTVCVHPASNDPLLIVYFITDKKSGDKYECMHTSVLLETACGCGKSETNTNWYSQNVIFIESLIWSRWCGSPLMWCSLFDYVLTESELILRQHSDQVLHKHACYLILLEGIFVLAVLGTAISWVTMESFNVPLNAVTIQL